MELYKLFVISFFSKRSEMKMFKIIYYIGMDKTSLETSSSTLFVREGGREDAHVICEGGCPRHVERNYAPLFGVAQSNVELRNYVPLFGVTQSNVELRNYVISRQIVI